MGWEGKSWEGESGSGWGTDGRTLRLGESVRRTDLKDKGQPDKV